MGRVAGIVAAVALCWGGWPLVARMAGPTGATGSLVLVLASLAPISLLALLSRDAFPSGTALGWLAAAGVLNGLGLVAFQLLATDREVEVSRVVPVMDTAMLLVTAAGGMLFFAEALTPTKALGIGLLVAGIALLRPGS